MCGPVGIALGVVSAGLGIMQAQAQYRAAQEQVRYNNQVARQQYEVSKMNAEFARTSEAQKAAARQQQIEQNESLARAAEAEKISQARQQYVEKQLREADLEARRARGALLASGRTGNVMQTLLADVDRQAGRFDFYSDRNLAFAGTRAQQQGRAATIERINRVSSIQPYMQQTILDPFEPVYQRAPSSTPYVLQGAGAVIGGAQTGLGIEGSINQAGFVWKDGGYRRVS
jgi:hypothetical protein